MATLMAEGSMRPIASPATEVPHETIPAATVMTINLPSAVAATMTPSLPVALFKGTKEEKAGLSPPPPSPPPVTTGEMLPDAEPTAVSTATPTVEPTAISAPGPTSYHIGDSAGGRPITSYRFGFGPTPIVLVGGMHGGYEWNSVLLAQEFFAYFTGHEAAIPASISLYIIPNVNPDGLAVTTGKETADLQLQPTDIITHTLAGRFNANRADLNRNWDCQWTEQGIWRDQIVSAGIHPFSEPETASLSRYFLERQPALVIFLHSTAGGVFPSGCPEMHPESAAAAVVYGLAAGYPIYPSFNYYRVTGDAGDWLSTQDIPSFTVELTTKDDIDWEQNLAGVQAILEHFHTAESMEPEEEQPYE